MPKPESSAIPMQRNRCNAVMSENGVVRAVLQPCHKAKLAGASKATTAIVAAIGTGDAFSKGRDFGAWLGLVLAYGLQGSQGLRKPES